MVEIVYDGDRPVQHILRREPEWDQEQRDLAVALTIYEAGLDELGFPAEESMSALADPNNPQATHHYVADPPVKNWAEYALEAAQKDPAWQGDNYSRSRRWRVRKVDGPRQ